MTRTPAETKAEMNAAWVRRAVSAASSTASELGLIVDGATVLNDSNRLVVRLLPCDVVARVTPTTHFASVEREVELAKQLSLTESPIAALEARVEPRVYVRDGFKITMWTYVQPVRCGGLPSDEYAQLLARLHAGLRRIEVAAPHVNERIVATQRDATNPEVTPDLAVTDRALLADTLHELGRSIVNHCVPDQLLHGEPHSGNILNTTTGPLFIDFENTAYGPVEYDLAWVPREVSELYLGADQDVVDECRGIVLAIIATHRWSRGDRHPSGRQSGLAFLRALRDGPPWPALNDVVW